MEGNRKDAIKEPEMREQEKLTLIIESDEAKARENNGTREQEEKIDSEDDNENHFPVLQ